MSIVTRSCRVPTADQRRAQWAYRYYAAGLHHTQSKPRIRVKPRIRIINTERGGYRAEIEQ